MNEDQKTKISKFLSLVLRHKPEAIDIHLDENGWASVRELIGKSADKGNSFTLEELKKIVATNDKKRFSFDESGTKIRANQGHSIKINLGLKEETPPKILYHGTAGKNLEAISSSGLQKMKRHHVHLSDKIETAEQVGIRYGKPIIFKVDTEKMLAEGFKFYISENGVWLVEEVPAEFLEILEKDKL